MLSFKYLQSSLILTALQICVCSGAQAGETQSGSEASVNPTTSASSSAGTEASQSSASQSSRVSSTQASSAAASEAKSPSRPPIISNQQTLQQVVNEVSRPDSRVAAPVHVHRRTAHWKTRYWNQKPKQKTP